METTVPVHEGRALSAALWTAQILLAILFLFAGIMKLALPIEQMAKQSHLPGPLLQFIGVAEIFGGIGLILPGLLRIRPILTPIAAFGLVIIMIGGTILSLPMGALAFFPATVCALTAFVAYGRLRLRPVLPRH